MLGGGYIISSTVLCGLNLIIGKCLNIDTLDLPSWSLIRYIFIFLFEWRMPSTNYREGWGWRMEDGRWRMNVVAQSTSWSLLVKRWDKLIGWRMNWYSCAKYGVSRKKVMKTPLTLFFLINQRFAQNQTWFGKKGLIV